MGMQVKVEAKRSAKGLPNAMAKATAPKNTPDRGAGLLATALANSTVSEVS